MPYAWRRHAALLALAMAACERGAAPAAEPPGIAIVTAVAPDGAASPLWLELVGRLRAGDREALAAAAAPRPLAPAERDWEALIRARAPAWQTRRRELAIPFQPIEPPAAIRVVLGNRAGEDAFTHDPRTIGFDLSRLAAEYGEATSDENRQRIDRFFAHEYTHLLQKAWRRAHPGEPRTAFERAELGMWLEGLGNYYSLSDRWRSRAGQPPPDARTALADLEPVLVARMSALACASAAEEAALTADLSQGPFTRKWGALPVALWLEAEASAGPDVLARFVRPGPPAVGELARRHLPAALAAELDRARARSTACPPR
jgi:hypothetical protein